MIPRLSDQNISDPILRASYYQMIREYIATHQSELIAYTVHEHDAYRYDLVSYRIYNTVALDWLIALVADRTDMIESLPVGQIIYLPKASYIRQSMRQFIDEIVQHD